MHSYLYYSIEKKCANKSLLNFPDLHTTSGYCFFMSLFLYLCGNFYYWLGVLLFVCVCVCEYKDMCSVGQYKSNFLISKFIHYNTVYVSMWAFVCVRVCACVWVCVHACMGSCVRAWVCVCYYGIDRNVLMVLITNSNYISSLASTYTWLPIAMHEHFRSFTK